MGLRDRIAALLGVSAFRRAERTPGLPTIDDPRVQRMRELHGGQLGLHPRTRTRWYLKDIETAELMADNGDLSLAAQLMRFARMDGTYAGVLSTRTGGLVRLPMRFRGPSDIVDDLIQKPDAARSLFDEMCPAAELALLAADGTELGVGVAELVPVQGRAHPVLVRQDPEFLFYDWDQNQWFYRSIAGLLPITPGDGRWVLHIPGGRVSPWQHGIWRAVGRAVVRKEHAALRKDSWEGKLANPARVAQAPHGATEAEHQDWLEQVMAWGLNTVFGLKPGYEVKLIESNGVGHESFEKTIADQNDELKIAVAGQVVTSDGGAGFQNSDIHKSIRADLIKETADGLAHTLNTQVLPPWIIEEHGEEALEEAAALEWDVTPPKDRNAEATALTGVATAITTLTDALAAHGMKPDVAELAARFGVPLAKVEAGELTLVVDNDDQDDDEERAA